MTAEGLRQINAAAADPVHTACMIGFARHQAAAAAPPQQPDTVREKAAMVGQFGLATVPSAIPAAWPAGVSQFAIAIDVCRRWDQVEMRSDWIAGSRA